MSLSTIVDAITNVLGVIDSYIGLPGIGFIALFLFAWIGLSYSARSYPFGRNNCMYCGGTLAMWDDKRVYCTVCDKRQPF